MPKMDDCLHNFFFKCWKNPKNPKNIEKILYIVENAENAKNALKSPKISLKFRKIPKKFQK